VTGRNNLSKNRDAGKSSFKIKSRPEKEGEGFKGFRLSPRITGKIQSAKQMVISVLVWLLVFYVVIIVGARLLENSFIYYPTKYPTGEWAPERLGLEVEDVFLTTEDGVKIHGWYAPAKLERSQPKANIVILLFHGNGGNLTDRIEKIQLLTKVGADVFAIDYRGYGRSEGRPNEAGIYEDGHTAYRYLTETRGIPSSRVVVLGESLGGAVATEIAVKHPVGGVILESTMTRARDLAIRTMPIVPPSLYLRTKFDNLQKISQIKAPVLIIYGTKDTTIPPSHSRRLYEAAREPKRILAIEGAGHNDLFILGHREYEQAVKDFLASIRDA